MMEHNPLTREQIAGVRLAMRTLLDSPATPEQDRRWASLAMQLIATVDARGCHNCGAVLQATRRDARYCSARCRVAAMRARRKGDES